MSGKKWFDFLRPAARRPIRNKPAAPRRRLGIEHLETRLAPAGFTANADSDSVNEDTLLTVAAPGVKSNDNFTSPPTTHVTLDVSPSHAASFSLNNDGSFTCRAAADYTGTDTFTYHLRQSSPLTSKD